MLVCTFVSLLDWCRSSIWRPQQRAFVHRYLCVGEHTMSVKFVHEQLRADGVFLLRLVAKNADHLVTTKIIRQLWMTFRVVGCVRYCASHRRTSALCRRSSAKTWTARTSRARRAMEVIVFNNAIAADATVVQKLPYYSTLVEETKGKQSFTWRHHEPHHIKTVEIY